VRVLFWKTAKPTEIVAPATSTPADLLSQVHRELKIAEAEFAAAHLATNNFLVQHPEHLPVKTVGDKVFLTFKPGDPEFQRLQSRENAAIANRAKAMARWSELRKKVDSRESQHVAGVRVR
jgi:hypothetical protein